MKKSDMILEGLHKFRINERVIFEDEVVVDNRRKFEDTIEQGLKNKYASAFGKYGKLDVSVETELTDDEDRDVIDAVDTLTLSLFFEDKTDSFLPNMVLSDISKMIRPFRGLRVKYDTRNDVFYVDLTKKDIIARVLWEMEKEGIALKKTYHIDTAADQEERIENMRAENREEKKYQRRYL